METSTETLTRAMADKASSQIERATAAAQEAVGQASTATLAASRRLRIAKEQLAVTADRWTESTRDYVRRNPFASLGVAMGVAASLALGAEFLYRHRERDSSGH
ncbi:MAG TPA: hypothetical protein VFW68_01645 [Rhodocyclaceae bacterium]|nr:hypothetical protein [Rhodocyclaceae bacterium]